MGLKENKASLISSFVMSPEINSRVRGDGMEVMRVGYGEGSRHSFGSVECSKMSENCRFDLRGVASPIAHRVLQTTDFITASAADS